MLVIGLILIPVSILIIMGLNSFNIKKSTKKLLNILLIGISILYIAIAVTANIEPFNFEITRGSDYLISLVLVIMFMPFLWINMYYYCSKLLFKRMRIRRNAKIKSDKQYKYYRDDLDKVSPSIVMFTSDMEIDLERCIAAVILKLKLNGYIKESDDELKYTEKKDDELLESEKLVLKSIKDKNIDEKLYMQLVEKEALNYKYIKKNNKGKILKLIKILITIIIPIILLKASMDFDEFVYDNYKTYIYDGKRYVSVEDGEIGDIHYGEIENIDDYYHGYIMEGNFKMTFYDKALIRVDKLGNSFVRKTVILQNVDAIICFISIIIASIMVFMVIEQIRYFNKSYIRTLKGNELVNKAHALKNYLKEYSLIKDRTQRELILWEYYLIYAVVLDVNVKIKNEIIEKYCKKNIL